MWLECTSESWITVDITKCSRKTIPHNRTANRKCTLPELSSCASYGGGSGSRRSEMTSLWVVCLVKCYQDHRDRKDNVFVRSDALVWSSWTWCDAWPEASAAVVVQDWRALADPNSAPVERPRFALVAVAPVCMQVDRLGLSCSSQTYDDEWHHKLCHDCLTDIIPNLTQPSKVIEANTGNLANVSLHGHLAV